MAIVGGVFVSAALAAGVTAWVSSPQAVDAPTALGERPALVPTAQACADAGDRWSAVWNEDRKAQRRAFETSSWPEQPGPNVHPKIAEGWSGIGRVNAATTLDGVRRFGDTWRSLYADTCADANGGTTSTSQLRRACLVDVLRRVDALITQPPAGTFAEALEEHRTMLARCTTHMVEALTLPEGETREAVDRARDLMATAEAARFARDQTRARTDIDEARCQSATAPMLEIAVQAASMDAGMTRDLRTWCAIGDSWSGSIRPAHLGDTSPRLL